MTNIKTIEGDFTGSAGKYALVVGRWNSFVVEHLLDGAIDALRRHGVKDDQLTIVRGSIDRARPRILVRLGGMPQAGTAPA